MLFINVVTLKIFLGRVGFGVRLCLLASPSSPLRAIPVNNADPLSRTSIAWTPSWPKATYKNTIKTLIQKFDVIVKQ